MPATSDEIVVSIVNPAAVVNAEATGPNFIWDFSDLISTGQRTDIYQNVWSTPFAYQFFFNNVFLYPDNESDYALSVDFPSLIPQLTFEEVMYYYKNADDAYYNTGFGATINDIPASVQGDPTDTLYTFPLAYEDTNSNDFFLELEIPGFGYYGQYGTRVDTVDGWGNITTPYGSFDALRVKSTLFITDTTYVDFISFGIAVDRPVAIEYKWLANGQGIPVFKVVNQLGFNTNAEYLDEAVPTSAYNGVKPELNAFPNPAKDQITIQLPEQAEWIEIRELSGALVKRIDLNKSQSGAYAIGLNDLSNGVYLLSVSSHGQAVGHQLFEKID